jgi:hypothetical protein
VQQKLLKENKDWLLTIFSYPQPIYTNLFSLCPAITRRSSLANQIILSAKFSEIYFIGGICKKPHVATTIAPFPAALHLPLAPNATSRE